METRKSEERSFHDHLRRGAHSQTWSLAEEEALRSDPLWANYKYYAIERRNLDFIRRWLKENCRGKRVLDFGCGNGEHALFAAENGAASVVGIDISEVAVENCRAQAKEKKLDHLATFRCLDGETMDFPDCSFDVAVEYGVLHHVDLDKAMKEIARVLTPDGRMICDEALGTNPLFHLYRKLTPQLRTPWEVDHLLTKKKVESLGRHFGVMDLRFYHLATLAAVPLRGTVAFDAVLRTLERVDDFVLSVPGMRWLAWQAVVTLGAPRKT